MIDLVNKSPRWMVLTYWLWLNPKATYSLLVYCCCCQVPIFDQDTAKRHTSRAPTRVFIWMYELCPPLPLSQCNGLQLSMQRVASGHSLQDDAKAATNGLSNAPMRLIMHLIPNIQNFSKKSSKFIREEFSRNIVQNFFSFFLSLGIFSCNSSKSYVDLSMLEKWVVSKPFIK